MLHDRGAVGGDAASGRHHGRRSSGADVRQPQRVPAGVLGRCLARRHHRAGQHRRPRPAVASRPVRFRRPAADPRSRVRTAAGSDRPRDRVRLGHRRRLSTARHRHAAARRHPTGNDDRRALHLRHHRPVQGRLLPARAVFLVGHHYRRSARRGRRRRPRHDAAAIPHQRAQRLLPSVAARRHPRRRAPLLRHQLLDRAGRAARPPSPTCWAPWCRSCSRVRLPRTTAPTVPASRWRPACPAICTRRSPSDSASA